MKTLILLVLCCLAASSSATATIELPAIISNNMVLQAGVKDRIWGTADPSERIEISIAGEEAATTADGNGRWSVEVGPLKAGGPYELTVRGKNTVVVRNVAVGQVWICSGQSNMEFPVAAGPEGWQGGAENYEQEIADAHYPAIRMFTVKKAVAGKPQKDLQGRWEVTSPVTVGHFSAVGYFFGRNLFKSLHEPVGMIHTSWGGSPAESWTTLPTLEALQPPSPLVQSWQELETKFLTSLNDFPSRLDAWRQAAQKAEAEGSPVPTPPSVGDDARANSWRPSGLYNAMIAPLVSYKIKGAIWYQGETNARDAMVYRTLFPAMIQDWRRAWNEGDFPFLYVQLANFKDMPTTQPFTLVREAQLMTLSLPNTAMAVAIDIGNPQNIHPRNKQEVGRRLALGAMAVAYGQNTEYSGPLYTSMSVEGNKIRLRFSHVDGGLAFSGGPWLRGFDIAGADRRFVSGAGSIDGDTVLVGSVGNTVSAPVAVRYDWENSPDGNLCNETGLPASPFRTDDWPIGSEAGQK